MSLHDPLGKFSLEKGENEAMEDDQYFHEEPITQKKKSEIKDIKKDFENIKQRESIETKKIFNYLNETDDVDDEEFALNLTKRDKSAFLQENNFFENQTDEYELIKASSYELSAFDFHKTRANSILKTLEAGCKNIRMDDD